MEGSAGAEPARSPARLVLLGASNLFFGLPGALRHALGRIEGRKLTIFTASGPGRSYGVKAGVCALRYRGIIECGVLDALEAARHTDGPAPAWALLTDIGNDILYQSGVERILAWIEETARRLAAAGARIGITSLPIESLERMPRWRFRLLRPVYFPFRPMPWEAILAQARAVQAGLHEIAGRFDAAVLAAPAAWYGFDHFHLGGWHRREAFGTWLDEILGARGPPPPPAARLEVSSLGIWSRGFLGAWRPAGGSKGVMIAPQASLFCL